MTREEAIEVLKAYRNKLTNSVSNQLDGDIEAFDMAIQALSQEPCDDAISRIKERIAYYENRKPKDGYDGVSYGKTEDGSGELKNPRQVEYERYSNRQIGLEEALEIIQNHSVTQKPIECDDAISREDALKEAYTIVIDGEKFDVVQVETLYGLPPVTPSRRKGHWEFYGRLLKCSECGKIWDDIEKECPNCGIEIKV